MGLAETMREASAKYSLQLTTDDTDEMQTYLSTVLSHDQLMSKNISQWHWIGCSYRWADVRPVPI